MVLNFDNSSTFRGPCFTTLNCHFKERVLKLYLQRFSSWNWKVLKFVDFTWAHIYLLECDLLSNRKTSKGYVWTWHKKVRYTLHRSSMQCKYALPIISFMQALVWKRRRWKMEMVFIVHLHFLHQARAMKIHHN